MQREEIRNGLIVSCQPVPAGPMDNAEFVTGFAKAALDAGACALRIESVAYVRAVRSAVTAPIIGIVKRDLSDSPVRITPYVSDAEALADAGADIVAFDATDRVRPATIEELVRAMKAKGKLTMADCSSLEDAEHALAAGVDFVGTTLSGYVGGPEPVDPDIDLIAAMRRLTPYVIAEGRIRSPEQAAAAVKAGAYAIVVGSAITRTEHVTSWFHEAVAKAYNKQEASSAETVLAVDIGGTKTMAALVKGGAIVDEVLIPTAREAGPDAWLEAIAESAARWRGGYARIGFAVTGLVQDGYWSALNPATLGIPNGYPLVDRATRLFGKPVFAMNDAQAAAWGEYKFGAGSGGNLVFLTISTGIGGGIVINGRPLSGLAGHFGLMRGPSQGRAPLEDETSGRWIAAEALKAGHEVEAAEVFERAGQGAPWARAIVSQSALRAATLCHDIQLMLDPDQIVIGGGIGLAAGYIDEMRDHLKDVAPRLAPRLVAAKLGSRAGIIGVADLAGEDG
ncbi:putative N-acetylmannosamine-6-phosphate 2-epimerase [Ensifer sp. IC3342]|nr:putative N-acetylmannosamine-6-phosphate 2-epimerase [Ensifer sp. BRP08]MCA1449519.1 putative N-acetylmannosamine-6-phosphate 2-epimerase [Ensifer sp. IC3342]